MKRLTRTSSCIFTIQGSRRKAKSCLRSRAHDEDSGQRRAEREVGHRNAQPARNDAPLAGCSSGTEAYPAGCRQGSGAGLRQGLGRASLGNLEDEGVAWIEAFAHCPSTPLRISRAGSPRSGGSAARPVEPVVEVPPGARGAQVALATVVRGDRSLNSFSPGLSSAGLRPRDVRSI